MEGRALVTCEVRLGAPAGEGEARASARAPAASRCCCRTASARSLTLDGALICQRFRRRHLGRTKVWRMLLRGPPPTPADASDESRSRPIYIRKK